MSIPCPDCSADLILPEQPRVGSVLICDNCGAEAELTALEPLAIALIEETK